MPILKNTKSQPVKTTTSTKGAQRAADPFAAKYAETEAAKGGGFVPPKPGTYNTILVEGQGVVDGDKTAAFITVQIVDEDEEDAGKNCRIYWNFTDENGQEASGMPYFKSNMQMLGVNKEFQSWDDMCETLAELAKEQPWLIINVVKKGDWTNIYLQSVPENQNEKPDLINPF